MDFKIFKSRKYLGRGGEGRIGTINKFF